MTEARPEVEELLRTIESGKAELGELRFVRCEPGLRVMGPGDASQPAPSDPEAFRHFIRFDEQGRYRPLSGAIGMRRDWFVDCASVKEAVQLVEIVYPHALRHRAQHRAGGLRVVDADAVLSRQTSRYADARTLTGETRNRAVDALCGVCAREPCWAGATGEGIPCPEPCSVFVALAQAIADWDWTDPTERTDPSVPLADFHRAGNEIRCRFLNSAPI